MVENCCLRNGELFRERTEYHGEITVDPETGAILRLTMESEPGWFVETDLSPVRPIRNMGMMVEFGPVEISGEKVIVKAGTSNGAVRFGGSLAAGECFGDRSAHVGAALGECGFGRISAGLSHYHCGGSVPASATPKRPGPFCVLHSGEGALRTSL